ncbi:MAG TPA: multiheme c-type cytochrome [Planctomycetota bacterium]|nr:multiheme c-type cytochrome [Planctomycetota bacterium]
MRMNLLLAGLMLATVSTALALQEGGKAPKPAQTKVLVLETPKPVPDGRIAKLEHLETYSCAQCHTEVADEWAATTHGLAWVDPIYREEIGGKARPEACHGCHIPKPLHLGQLGAKPEARADTKEDPWEHGVSCETCHLGPEGKILGPWGHATSAHASQRADSMVDAGSTALCLSCHRINIGPVIGVAKDFESSNQAARGRSCVGCHWASVERSWANAPAGNSTAVAAGSEAPPQKGRSHATQTPRDPAFLRQAFEVSLKIEAGKSVVTIRNAIAHRVPGLIGRSLEFTASVLDANGKVVAEKKQVFDARAHLPVDQSVDLVLDGVGAQVRLVGMHHDPRLEKPVQFLDEVLAPAGK